MNSVFKACARKMLGRCTNGAERDGGKVLHLVVDDKETSWAPALCGAKPGMKGNGWGQIHRGSDVTCQRCKLKYVEYLNVNMVKLW